MGDKFITFGIDDDRSKDIAEVLKNDSCRKILDYMADAKESSEQDIATALDMPLNTTEYNLNKLVKAGLVEKAKFLWSSKGRKIDYYNLARKHIVISPKIAKPSSTMLKAIIPIILAVAVVIVILALYLQPSPGPGTGIDQLKKFASYDELKTFLKENIDVNYGYGFGMMEKATSGVTAGASGAQDSAQAYSTTNIQVEGVDEADIVKNDGEYIYVVSGKKVVIVDAYPAENMKILSEIDLNKSVRNIFVNKDKLVIFAEDYNKNIVSIYDVSDRSNPVLDEEIKADGYYVDSRMINDYVYVISSKYVNMNNPEPPVYIVGGLEKKVEATDVYYFDYPDTNYVFTAIMAINLDDNEFNSKVFLTGATGILFVSQNNIYLTYTKTIEQSEYVQQIVEEVYLPIMPTEYDKQIKEIVNSDENKWTKLNKINKLVWDYSASLEGEEKSEFDEKLMQRLQDFEIEIQKKYEKTVIHKINVDNDEIEYKKAGEAPGTVLNQFSMDEYNGYFRIATTTGHVSRTGEATSLNHLYVLDKDMEIVGKVEDLAKGERIYSARFMGKRAYIVTFKKVDPLFVIDLSNPKNPEVLGYLKITGYSDYLHPYDENHIIGIGKETRGGDEQFSWYQGVKISLFDVSDVENPVEEAKIEIGDRGTNSDALYEHKAFLFDREKNLLVIPIMLAEINESQYEGETPDNAYGEVVWQGAYVLNIGLDGISLRGKITHDDNQEGFGRYYYGGKYSVTRSLYMDDYLYTISAGKIKANNLNTVEEISSVELPYEEERYYPVY